MPHIRLLTLCAFVFFGAVCLDTEVRAVEATPASAVTTEGSLEVARSGADVMITWKLPQGEFRQIEIYRNTNNGAPGRSRAAAVRSETMHYMDKVPDLTVTYWYWLKLTRKTGEVVNIGPVPTPSPTVWQP